MPSVIILALLTIVPTIFLYFVSFTNYELGQMWNEQHLIGFQNFIRLFSGQDTEFWLSVGISLLFMVLATFFETFCGFVVALLLNREFKLKSLVFACLLVPITITPSIVGQMWKLMYNAEYGVINYIMGLLFHTKIIWLGPAMAYTSTLLVDIWQWTPFMALIIYAGISSVPAEPYEAALVDGANAVQSFRYITLPLLKPLLSLAILFRSMDSLKLFDVPFVLTQGGPGSATELLSLHVYRLGFAQTGWVARASATGVILLIIISILSQFLIRQLHKESGPKI
ncbi:MAG TPA: sugar ABC transporter permease [Firmicutes bacterium]|jgi:multiple sugar transport system permease protein|nr:sugar ABC transporter permease [Bacillota bacterium]